MFISRAVGMPVLNGSGIFAIKNENFRDSNGDIAMKQGDWWRSKPCKISGKHAIIFHWHTSHMTFPTIIRPQALAPLPQRIIYVVLVCYL